MKSCLCSNMYVQFLEKFFLTRPHLPRFMAYLSLFTFFMLILVTADSARLAWWAGSEGLSMRNLVEKSIWTNNVVWYSFSFIKKICWWDSIEIFLCFRRYSKRLENSNKNWVSVTRVKKFLFLLISKFKYVCCPVECVTTKGVRNILTFAERIINFGFLNMWLVLGFTALFYDLRLWLT